MQIALRLRRNSTHIATLIDPQYYVYIHSALELNLVDATIAHDGTKLGTSGLHERFV